MDEQSHFETRRGIAFALCLALAPVLVVVAQLASEHADGGASEEWFVSSQNGVLLRHSTNAGKHLFPYMATVVAGGILFLGCICLVQNGSKISSWNG